MDRKINKNIKNKNEKDGHHEKIGDPLEKPASANLPVKKIKKPKQDGASAPVAGSLHSSALKKKLTPKERLFVKEYLIDFNGSASARRAGYKGKNSDIIAGNLMAKVKISESIRKAIEEREKRTEVTADYVLTTIRDTVERCRQAQPVISKDGPTGEYEFDATAVLKGCELLGKHLKLFTEKFEATGKDGEALLPKRVVVELVNGRSQFADNAE